jgi:S1-C subfamily serine protease
MGISTDPQPLTAPEPLLSRRHRGLVLIAIFAGMATAAAFVLVQTLKSLAANDPARIVAAKENAPAAKPSAFGVLTPTAPLPPDVKLSGPQIAKAGNQAIVRVFSYDENDKLVAQGVGYIYAASGLIITSYGAIRGASTVEVETASGEELNVIALMGYNPGHDTAALAVLEGSLPTLETGAAEVVQEGEAVVALGPGNATSSGVVGVRRAIGGVDLIQITAPAADGWPVLNQHGKVIGIATHRKVGGQTLTFTTPSRYISDMLAEKRVLSFADMLRETGQL